MAKLNLTLPVELEALKGRQTDIILFDMLPHLWQRYLWGKPAQLTDPMNVLGEETFYKIVGSVVSPTVGNIKAQQTAGQTAIDANKLPVGWYVPGEGNLTRIMLAWADSLVALIKGNKAAEAILSLGGRSTRKSGLTLRGCPDILSLLRTLPVRAHGSVNGMPVDRPSFGGLALLGVAMAPARTRPQDLLKRSPETDDSDVAAGELRGSGWGENFIPENDYGVMGPLAELSLRTFSGHLELSFRDERNAVLDIWASQAPIKLLGISQDLRDGICHIPHDQLKNASVGQGVRGCWLVDGEIRSLPGAGSKPEKFLARNKLVLGTGAIVPNPVPSAIQFQTAKGAVPAVVGTRIPVVLTTWSLHGSGQIFVKPGVTLSAATEHRRTLQLTPAEYQACRASLPKVGDTFRDGEPVIQDLLDADGDVVVTFVDVARNEYSGDVDVKLRWERWVHDYNGFKLKGLGLKGSCMPLVGPNTTDIWAKCPGAEYLVNFESAKGSAFTLAMWAEARGGLVMTGDDLSEAELAEYQAWLAANTRTLDVQLGIASNLVEDYRAAGHTVAQLPSGQWVVKETIEVLQGHVVAEIEAPLTAHRRTRSSLSLMQAALLADEIEAL